jgi:type 1 fimbria pilin
MLARFFSSFALFLLCVVSTSAHATVTEKCKGSTTLLTPIGTISTPALPGPYLPIGSTIVEWQGSVMNQGEPLFLDCTDAPSSATAYRFGTDPFAAEVSFGNVTVYLKLFYGHGGPKQLVYDAFFSVNSEQAQSSNAGLPVQGKNLTLPITTENGVRGVYIGPGDMEMSLRIVYTGGNNNGPLLVDRGILENKKFEFRWNFRFPEGAPYFAGFNAFTLKAIPDGKSNIALCAIDPQSLKPVALPTVRSSDLAATGEPTILGEQRVHLGLACLPPVWESPLPTITLSSPREPANNSNLLPLEPGSKSASGVQIGLFSSTGNKLNLNTPVKLADNPSEDWDRLWVSGIDFLARYVKVNNDATPGQITSVATVNIEYP